MRLNNYYISEILKYFNIKNEIKNHTILLEINEYSNPLKIKEIVKIELDNFPTLVVKIGLEEDHSQCLIEQQCIFSEQMRANGIKTARRFKSKDFYCISYQIDDLLFDVTVEEYIGEEIKCIGFNCVMRIAKLMADMHNIAQKNDLHINGETIWNIFNDKTDIMFGYTEYKKLLSESRTDLSEYDFELHQKIMKLYNKRKDKLKKVWSELPRYATQGDYSINNLVENIDSISIFDYNIAGDEVLINDMIVEGLLTAKEMDLEKGLTDKDRDALFLTFVRTYVEHRKLSAAEMNVMNDIYAVVYPFWFTRILNDPENSLKALFEKKDLKSIRVFLEETYKLLSLDYF